jgi:ribonuclease-3
MGGRSKDVILADAVEAVIGFLTIDGWIPLAQQFVEQVIYTKWEDLDRLPSKSFKSMLQELTQEHSKILPEYQDTPTQTDEKWNILLFQTQIFLDGKCVGTGEGSNKKKSHEQAAQNAYLQLTQSQQ